MIDDSEVTQAHSQQDLAASRHLAAPEGSEPAQCVDCDDVSKDENQPAGVSGVPAAGWGS